MSAVAPGVVLVETKLHAPRVRAGMVARDMLVVRLAGGVNCRLVLVCAPAGWGKSMLLSQWRAAERDHRPFAWVSLDPSDDDPVRFWSYVIAALQTVQPGFGAAVLGALPSAELVDFVLPRLLNDLAALPTPVVLVLDDFHVIRNAHVHASVAYLLRHAPRTLQLALATRADPPLPLARLRAAGELLEIRADDLRFNDDEAGALLNDSLRLGLAAEDVELLQERTEGWPAGLQLAALSLRGRSDRAAFIRSFAGDDRHVGDYLGEVLEGASAPLREFLLRTSILERLCAPLCDAVTGRADSGELLGEAFRSNLFVVALDERAHWFRYHHLLRDLLRRELARREPELVADLHGRASAWHWRAGDIDEAIVHAIAAGELESAADLIAAHWRPAWHANAHTVERWLEALPAGAVEADARLCLISAWTALFLGRRDEIEPLIEVAEINPQRAAAPDELGALETRIALLRASAAYMGGDIGATHEQARRAESDPAPVARALAGMMLGLAAFHRADGAGAAEAFERVRRTPTGADELQILITTAGHLALVYLESGDSAAAERLLGEAEGVIARFGLVEAPTAAVVHSLRAGLLELRGDQAGAEREYARAEQLARRQSWWLDLGHALLLHAALRRRRRDVAGARALAREARLALAECPDPGVLGERLESLERTLQLARGAEPTFTLGEELSERELAVLRLLATNLSQREIGGELYVSFNTVKTHTRTVFRKLGVTSRADAVSRGRELGLI